MKANEGTADRAIRVIVGLAWLSVCTGPIPGWGLIGLIGLLPLATGLIGFCPVYRLLGVDTLGGTFRKAARTPRRETPRDTARRAYARGEMSKEEYERLRSDPATPVSPAHR